ncbi:DUF6402 family protein, partial [Acidovorax sp. SUPP1855]|uniref:DUF6402 family protein n=1 Tax=Acidovorax sp. SUPP1855 TaxID=431774 RepID=UPI0024E0A5A5
VLARGLSEQVELQGATGSDHGKGWSTRSRSTRDRMGFERFPYDFNDAAGEDQDLGNWNFESNSVGRTGLNGGFNVRNSDFRKWRSTNRKGGDFLIYSDMRVLKQTTNNTFLFKP